MRGSGPHLMSSMSSQPARASTGESPRTATSILWLRRDLRLDDHEALRAANNPALYSCMLPLYCLDVHADAEPRRTRDQGGLGIPKLGPHRARCVDGKLYLQSETS